MQVDRLELLSTRVLGGPGWVFETTPGKGGTLSYTFLVLREEKRGPFADFFGGKSRVGLHLGHVDRRRRAKRRFNIPVLCSSKQALPTPMSSDPWCRFMRPVVSTVGYVGWVRVFDFAVWTALEVGGEPAALLIVAGRLVAFHSPCSGRGVS